ncbi:hypothetical protein, partial [Thermoclostridium caenicola]|uniref:hypothetical protein n=1 Tax=Thermoclostridium caenicola TaxID=659425 RepID=UPI001A9B43AA
ICGFIVIPKIRKTAKKTKQSRSTAQYYQGKKLRKTEILKENESLLREHNAAHPHGHLGITLPLNCTPFPCHHLYFPLSKTDLL